MSTQHWPRDGGVSILGGNFRDKIPRSEEDQDSVHGGRRQPNLQQRRKLIAEKAGENCCSYQILRVEQD